MPSFDLDSLLNFTPPQAVCERCCALLTHLPPEGVFRCPVCGAVYVPTDDAPNAAAYLNAQGCAFHFDDVIAHGQRLAAIARRARTTLEGQNSDFPPMRALLSAISAAQSCIHFTTFGISAMMLGVLKLAAQRIPVRGIISGVKRDEMYKELTLYSDESPLFATRLYGQESQWFPHQKIIIIDGLLAFKGSANLTDIGWRKAAHGREVLEIITQLREIQELNNRFFSPAWIGFENNNQPSSTHSPQAKQG